MTFWTSRLPRRQVRANKPRPPIPFRPWLELLEDRLVPTAGLTFHGGPVITSVQAQAVFLGSGWNQQPYQSQTTFLNNFLQTVAGTATAPSAYLNMLGAAGFAGNNGTVGSGNTLAPVIDSSVTIPGTVLTDAQIQADLENAINHPNQGVQQPGANSLYVVFVQPGVVVDLGDGNSINTFSAYHNSFTDPDTGATVVYTVTPYAGPIPGTNTANSQAPWLSPLDSMTMFTSHEVAEAVISPPQPNAPKDGYYDSSGDEAADIVNGSTVYLNGFAVQRISAIDGSTADDLALTPTGATAGHSVTFSLSSSGVLTKTEAGGSPVVIATGVASISPQSIDNFGQPMIDVVFTDGNAFEYHDFLPDNPLLKQDPGFFPWTFLAGPAGGTPDVYQAVAGQGVSYVLLANGNLAEFVDPNYTTTSYGFGVNPTLTGTRFIASDVTSIDGVGLSAEGGNTVTYTTNGFPHVFNDVAVAQEVAGTAQAPFQTPSLLSDAINGGFPSSRQGLAVLFTVPTPSYFSTAATTLPVEVPTENQSEVVPTAGPSAQFIPDGGGGEDSPTGEESAAVGPNGLTPSDAAAALSDVPVVGPLLLEAGRHMKAIQSMLPSKLWQAPPPKPAVPPAGPKEPPQSEAPAPDRLKGLAANTLLAMFSFGFAGLIHEEEERRRLARRANGGERSA